MEYFAFHADHIHEPTPRAKLIFEDFLVSAKISHEIIASGQIIATSHTQMVV